MPIRSAFAGVLVDLPAQQVDRVVDVRGPGERLGGGAAARVPVHVTKSIFGPAMVSTIWFQVPASPAATMPSGQFAGVVSTAPTLMVGSTAFIASEYATTWSAYPAGLLSAWSSASQAAP